MPAIAMEIGGLLLESRGDGVLLVDPSLSKVYVRCAFVALGSNEPIFPDSVLDDWGHERNSLALYQWIDENGDQFPRAELFGFDIIGKAGQWFLRELDLQSKYCCFGYPDDGADLEDGIELSHIVLSQEGVHPAERIQAPVEMPLPLHRAAVTWWRVDVTEAETFGRQLLYDMQSE